MLWHRIKSHSRYYFKETVRFFGWCPNCWGKVNKTRTGRAICPNINCR